MKGKLKRARLLDVAKLAGVSTGLASTVLRGTTTSNIRVSTTTAERVIRAAEELGYVPNSVARSLSEGKKRIFGVFTYEPVFSPETADHYSPFLFGIQQECEALGYDLLLVTSSSTSPEPRKVIDGAVNRLDFTDGGILFGHEPDTKDIEQLAAMGFPYVFIGRRELASGEALSVAADYSNGTAEMVRLMLNAGHRSFVYVGLPSAREYARDREQGFNRGLGEQPDARAVSVWRGDIEDLRAGTLSDWRARGATAIVFETPGQAQRFLAVAEAMDPRDPWQPSFVVLADIQYSEVSEPEWATLVVPRVAMGRAAVRLLEQVVNHSTDVKPQFIPCTIRLGSSIRTVSTAVVEES